MIPSPIIVALHYIHSLLRKANFSKFCDSQQVGSAFDPNSGLYVWRVYHAFALL